MKECARVERAREGANMGRNEKVIAEGIAVSLLLFVAIFVVGGYLHLL
ncbi:MAG: hypothetical protein ACJ741_02240 [Pyrinomonadaceae bacterium]